MDELLQTIYSGVIKGELSDVEGNVNKAIGINIPADEILNMALIPAMAKVGSLFEEGEYYIPEMLVSALAMKAALEVLKPLLVKEQVKSKGKVVIGSVKGDLHDIGKNLVAMLLEGAGFEVIDLGVDVAPEAFVAAVRTSDASIVAMSALLTTTMSNMKATIDTFEEAGLRDAVKIMVGGAPVTQAFVDAIGADGFALDAGQAASLAKSWV